MNGFNIFLIIIIIFLIITVIAQAVIIHMYVGDIKEIPDEENLDPDFDSHVDD